MKSFYTRIFLSLSLIFILIVIVLKNERFVEILQRIHYSEFIMASIITSIAFYLSGIQINYITLEAFKINLRQSDIFLLPITMHLWSYILPSQGGIIFSTIFLQRKYKLNITSGYSIGIYIFFIGLLITGIICFLIMLVERKFNTYLFAFGIFSVILPYLLYIVRDMFSSLELENRIFKKLVGAISRLLDNLTRLYQDKKQLKFIGITTVLGIVIYVVMHLYANHVLLLEIPFLQVLFMALVSRLSVIVRFVPGNMGVQEILTATGNTMLGGQFEDGLIIAIFIRCVTLLLAIVFGILGMMLNIQHFSFKAIRNNENM